MLTYDTSLGSLNMFLTMDSSLKIKEVCPYLNDLLRNISMSIGVEL